MMMERSLTIILVKEKGKNDDGEVFHNHFGQRKRQKMMMERSLTIILVKEKGKNDDGEVFHNHFGQRKRQK